MGRRRVGRMKYEKPYVVSRDKSGAWYCHMRGYPYVPVFGSIGDKKKADNICKTMNESVGKARNEKC